MLCHVIWLFWTGLESLEEQKNRGRGCFTAQMGSRLLKHGGAIHENYTWLKAKLPYVPARSLVLICSLHLVSISGPL